MAPEVTSTMRWPSARSWAASAQNLATADSSISPWSVVMEDVPILVTTITAAPSRLFFVVEGEAADVHGVAGPGAGARQRLVDAEGAQAAVGLVERLDVREVGQGDGPLRLAAGDGPAAVVASIDPVALRRRPVHHVGIGLGKLRPS